MKIWYNDGTVKAKGLSESEIPQLLSKALPPRLARSVPAEVYPCEGVGGLTALSVFLKCFHITIPTLLIYVKNHAIGWVYPYVYHFIFVAV